MKLQAYENSYYGNGAISMDINYDHFALAEIDETGKLLDQKMIRFDLVKNRPVRSQTFWERLLRKSLTGVQKKTNASLWKILI